MTQWGPVWKTPKSGLEVKFEVRRLSGLNIRVVLKRRKTGAATIAAIKGSRFSLNLLRDNRCKQLEFWK